MVKLPFSLNQKKKKRFHFLFDIDAIFLIEKIMKIATPHIISDCYIFSEKKKNVQVNEGLTVKAYKKFLPA